MEHYDYRNPFKRKVSILGVNYTCILEKTQRNPRFDELGVDGYVDYSVKEIHVAIYPPESQDSVDVTSYRRSVMRHEIVHAFLFESGLYVSSGRVNAWAQNEEMVDWIALKFPKLAKVYGELDILN